MVALGSVAVLAAPLVHADVFGVGASVNYWHSDFTGEFARNNSLVDVDEQLNLGNDSNANATVYLEHPVPLIPNVRLNYTLVQQSGRGNLDTGYDGVTGKVNSELDLEQLDLTLYYELLDNWINLDLGLTVRDFSAELLVQGEAPQQTSETTVDAVLPLGYAAARFDLPFSGLSLGAEVNAIGYNGDSVYDVNAYGQYTVSLLQLRAGYRQMAIDYEDGDDRLDVELSGPFASIGLAF